MAITSYNNNTCLQTVVDMFGIDPLKFNCLYPTCIEYDDLGCEQFWTQYHEKGNVVSREELAAELYRAEIEVAQYLEQFPFETYIKNEHINVDSYYRNRHILGVNLTNYVFQTKWGCVQDFGTFENQVIGSATVTYIDQDSDGFKELAEIEFDYSAVTETFNVEDLVLRFPGYYNYNNEVCPILSIENDTVNSIITFMVDSWNLVNPELYIYRKFTTYSALDACDDSIYVDTLDVTIKVKTCKPDGWIYYDENCATGCEEVAYPFCARVENKRLGTFTIIPGTVDDNGCFVEGTNCLPNLKPKRVEINYLSGCDECYESKNTQTVCSLIERAIIYIAIARMPRLLCECGCSAEFVEELKYDTSITYANSSVKFNFPFVLRNNSVFGTKIGELEAYKILSTIKDQLC